MQGYFEISGIFLQVSRNLGKFLSKQWNLLKNATYISSSCTLMLINRHMLRNFKKFLEIIKIL